MLNLDDIEVYILLKIMIFYCIEDSDVWSPEGKRQMHIFWLLQQNFILDINTAQISCLINIKCLFLLYKSIESFQYMQLQRRRNLARIYLCSHLAKSKIIFLFFSILTLWRLYKYFPFSLPECLRSSTTANMVKEENLYSSKVRA